LRLAILYLGGVCLLSLFARLVAERLWWTTLLVYIPQVAYLAPAGLVLLPVLWSRDARALAVFCATLLFIAGPLMGYNVPMPLLSRGDAPRVRVLAYNIRGALSGIDLIQAEVDRYRPDVAVFAEARGWRDDAELRADLEATFPEWSYADGGDMFIASRWPIEDTESLPLGTYRTGDPSMDRVKLRARVRAPFGDFQVVGVHFRTAVYGRTLLKEWRSVPGYMRHTGRIRREQADDLVDWLKTLEGPVILAGDFNTPPAGSIYRALTRNHGDAFAARGFGWGYTYPSRRPLLRIDYVFHSRDWNAVQCEVGSGAGSDHRPVFAELALRSRR
jgi:vancomycin resistance protein VanJ